MAAILISRLWRHIDKARFQLRKDGGFSSVGFDPYTAAGRRPLGGQRVQGLGARKTRRRKEKSTETRS